MSAQQEEKGVLRPFDQPRAGAVRRILVCLDRSPASETCLPVAVALAKSCGSELQLLHVLESGSSTPEVPPADAVGWLVGRAEAEDYLAGVVARFSAQGLSLHTAVVAGHVAEQILCFADRDNIDLIVLSSHGEKGLTEWSLGSTTEKVLARTRASVLVVPVRRAQSRWEGEAALERILVLLDGSPRAESVLPLVQQLALQRGAKLILLHAATPPQLFEARPLTAHEVSLGRRLADHNERCAQDYLAQIRARLAREGCAAQEMVEKGDLRSFLPAVTAREKIDLIAITSHGRTGDRSCSYGDTAGHLVRHARVPILMLQSLPQRPSEFAAAVRHRRQVSPLRGSHTHESS